MNNSFHSLDPPHAIFPIPDHTSAPRNHTNPDHLFCPVLFRCTCKAEPKGWMKPRFLRTDSNDSPLPLHDLHCIRHEHYPSNLSRRNDNYRKHRPRKKQNLHHREESCRDFRFHRSLYHNNQWW